MQIVKLGRIALGLFLNLLAVWIGTALFSSMLGRGLWHPHSIQALLRVSYCYDLFAALLLGFIVYRLFKTETAKWVWIIVGIWFFLRATTLLGSSSSLWSQLSGIGCVNGSQAIACRNWLLFTTPFVRAMAYSMGAWLGFRFGSSTPSTIEDGFVGKFPKPEWPPATDK
jgi:hypothetical protein